MEDRAEYRVPGHKQSDAEKVDTWIKLLGLGERLTPGEWRDLREFALRGAHQGHVHKCMSCGGSWYCPHPPSDCKAGENVLPSITLRGPDGSQVFHHVCDKEAVNARRASAG